MTLKRGIYYFRRRLPERPGQEVTVSLGTRHFGQAQRRASVLNLAFERIVTQMADKADIAKIVRKYLQDQLAWDMEDRVKAGGRSVRSALLGTKPQGLPQEEDMEWAERQLELSKLRLVNRQYDDIKRLIDHLMTENNVTEAQRAQLAHGVLRADIEFWEGARDRAQGKFPSVLIDLDALPSPTVVVPSGAGEAPSAEVASALFSEVLPQFLSNMSEVVRWREQTRLQNEASYRSFVEVCGDKPVAEYTRRDLGNFYNLLRRLPAMYSKSAEYRDKSLVEIADMTASLELDRLTMRTMKRHFTALSRFFGYLKQQGLYAAENPAKGFEFPKKGRADEKRQPWDGERLSKLFSSPVWSGCWSKDRRSKPGTLIIRDAKYWLPIMGLYHGNRLEEFAQLRREDVRHAEGHWYFDINDAGERQIKNDQSKRRVPVHPKLIELGFLEYLDDVAPLPASLIFPELKQGGPDKKLGYYFTKWWPRYRRSVGLYEKMLDYHSFRHGFTTKLFAADVSEPLIDALTGHAGKSTSRTVYMKKLPLKVLFDALSKVSWPELEGLLLKPD